MKTFKEFLNEFENPGETIGGFNSFGGNSKAYAPGFDYNNPSTWLLSTPSYLYTAKAAFKGLVDPAVAGKTFSSPGSLPTKIWFAHSMSMYPPNTTAGWSSTGLEGPGGFNFSFGCIWRFKITPPDGKDATSLAPKLMPIKYEIYDNKANFSSTGKKIIPLYGIRAITMADNVKVYEKPANLTIEKLHDQGTWEAIRKENNKHSKITKDWELLVNYLKNLCDIQLPKRLN
jgi:hypothetical protein